jgi:hypothetical protein
MNPGVVDPPEEIIALGPEAVAELEALVAAAERRQVKDLTDALDGALRIVPKPLRPVIRKVVGVR